MAILWIIYLNDRLNIYCDSNCDSKDPIAEYISSIVGVFDIGFKSIFEKI